MIRCYKSIVERENKMDSIKEKTIKDLEEKKDVNLIEEEGIKTEMFKRG